MAGFGPSAATHPGGVTIPRWRQIKQQGLVSRLKIIFEGQITIKLYLFMFNWSPSFGKDNNGHTYWSLMCETNNVVLYLRSSCQLTFSTSFTSTFQCLFCIRKVFSIHSAMKDYSESFHMDSFLDCRCSLFMLKVCLISNLYCPVMFAGKTTLVFSPSNFSSVS